MLILGWRTNDDRGAKKWAALWSVCDTPASLAAARRYMRDGRLDGYVFAKDNRKDLTAAKAEVLADL